MFSCTSETCTQAEQGKPAGTQTKNAPHYCEALGAENETRTISCNVLIISDLEEAEKTTGETVVKLSWLFRTYRGSDVKRHGKNVSCHEVP